MPGVPVKFDPPGEWNQTLLVDCPNSKKKGHPGTGDVYWREHESSCGGYDDTEFECRLCGHRWWIDGIDS